MKVIVNGANGRMGAETVKAVLAESDLDLVAQADTGDDLRALIQETTPDVVVDFTTPDVVMQNCRLILEEGVAPLVGTTGLSEEELNELDRLAVEKNVSILICPNFAIGAVLMMKFAQEASKYMPSAEIVEYHHDQKLDAPSGTAIKTAEMMHEANPSLNVSDQKVEETEIIPGSRGGEKHRIPIHSVRLRGFVASQDVVFGGQGQTLTISHHTISRESFMPGVVLAIRKMPTFKGLRYGLETVL